MCACGYVHASVNVCIYLCVCQCIDSCALIYAGHTFLFSNSLISVDALATGSRATLTQLPFPGIIDTCQEAGPFKSVSGTGLIFVRQAQF